jgi:hypothetical protein
MRKYCDREKKFAVEILADLHVFCTSEYEKVVFILPSLCLYVCSKNKGPSSGSQNSIVIFSKSARTIFIKF